MRPRSSVPSSSRRTRTCGQSVFSEQGGAGVHSTVTAHSLGLISPVQGGGHPSPARPLLSPLSCSLVPGTQALLSILSTGGSYVKLLPGPGWKPGLVNSHTSNLGGALHLPAPSSPSSLGLKCLARGRAAWRAQGPNVVPTQLPRTPRACVAPSTWTDHKGPSYLAPTHLALKGLSEQQDQLPCSAPGLDHGPGCSQLHKEWVSAGTMLGR